MSYPKVMSYRICIIVFIFIIIICKSSPALEELYTPLYGYVSGAGNKLYRLLSTVKSVFEKYDIEYSISGEVLLSAVERQKLKRSQSVASILIKTNSVHKLLETNTAFNEFGLRLDDLPGGGFRLSRDDGCPCVNIYPVAFSGDKWSAGTTSLERHEWYGSTELFPTKMYKLDNLYLPGPQNPLQYLKRNFWDLGLGKSEVVGVPKKRWYDLSRYKTHFLEGQERYVAHALPGKQTVIMGNGSPAIVPQVGYFSPRRRWKKIDWKKYFWD